MVDVPTLVLVVFLVFRETILHVSVLDVLCMCPPVCPPCPPLTKSGWARAHPCPMVSAPMVVVICLSASFTQYTVTITQVQESMSDFNLESESGDFEGLESESHFLNHGVGSPTKN